MAFEMRGTQNVYVNNIIAYLIFLPIILQVVIYSHSEMESYPREGGSNVGTKVILTRVQSQDF